MSQPTKTQALKAFLNAFAPSDLAALYNHDMEVQVTVAADGGNRIQGDFKGKAWNGYTDQVSTWKPIRIPYNAMSEPSYDDGPITFDLAKHAEGIGMTGWDWKNRISRWVAFDFDAISGHSERHRKKLDDAELLRVRDLLSTIPWVTLRRSTGGKGLHVYVMLEPITTSNHTEHSAVARAILSQLSGFAGFEFHTKVDTCGGNMWVWHRKLKTATNGLELLKIGTVPAKIPPNWKDYIAVVAGRRQRALPWFVEEQKAKTDNMEEIFDQLTGQRMRVQLDIEHKRVMDWLHTHYPSCTWWQAEHHMLVTHSALLKECHEALSLRGRFETKAHGSEKGYDHNVFLFPIGGGAWAVRRYSLGVEEHQFWEQDGAGWTRCFFNRDPDLAEACRIHNGLERPGGGYFFEMAEDAEKAATLLGASLNLPRQYITQKTLLKMDKASGKLTVVVDKTAEMPGIPGWIVENKKVTKLFVIRKSGPAEPEIMRLDEQVRHLSSEGGEDCGWVVKNEGVWNSEPYQNVKVYLTSLNYSPKDVSNIMGSSVGQCWRLVNKPFQKEYPSNREWNRNAPQLAFKPSLDKDNLHYPTWLKILTHLGQGLNDAVKLSDWCKQNGVLTGADYLKCWIAALFQFPMEPLPYLFFYSTEENTGKSSLHEALSWVISGNGVTRADNALTSQANFNGELEGAVICVVEETDLRKNVSAHNRIKDWVTARTLPIHVKGRTPYGVPNTTHWIQCANSHLYCPVFPGDTRITMTQVLPLDKETEIPKRQLEKLLKEEAPDFLAEMLTLEVPPYNGRLYIPILTTEDKMASAFSNQSFLEMFIAEKCYYAPGYRIKFSEFCDRFIEWLDPNIVNEWSKIRIGKEVPPKFPKGRVFTEGSQFYLGNISWVEVPPEGFGPRYVCSNNTLIVVNDNANGSQVHANSGRSRAEAGAGSSALAILSQVPASPEAKQSAPPHTNGDVGALPG